MAESEIRFSSVNGYPLIKFKGNLSISSLNTFHLVLSGVSEEGSLPVILDLTKALSISDGVKMLNCESISGWLRDLDVFVVGPTDRLTKIKTILGFPHRLGHAESIQEAVKILDRLKIK